MRICSLLPGATEVVAALGLADDLVGISHECDYPPEVCHKPIMVRAAIDAERASSPEIDRQVRAALESHQRLYTLDEPRILQAQPDLIITQALCHVCAVTPDQLERAVGALPRTPKLLALNPSSLNDVLADTERIGAATGRELKARNLTAALRSHLEEIRERLRGISARPRVACLEWLDPLFAGGHWIPEMVEWAGGLDTLGVAAAPSRQVSWEQVRAAEPEVLVLMPCGFTAARTLRELDRVALRPGWAALPAVRSGRVFAVDSASYFSRPGPRLVHGIDILAALCHPTVFGPALPSGAQRVDSLQPGSR